MSSFGAAQAASTRPQRTIIGREQIADGFVARINLPKNMDPGKYPDGDRQVSYFHFARTVRGGAIHFFLHSDGSGQLEQSSAVTAEVKIMRKWYDDGSDMFYIDLFPTEKPVTHQLSVMTRSEGSWTGTDWPIIETNAPVEGLIIMSPPGAKLLSAQEAAVCVRPANDTVQSAKDPQLDWLIVREGWSVVKQLPNKVELSRVRHGKTKTMTYYRPQKK